MTFGRGGFKDQGCFPRLSRHENYKILTRNFNSLWKPWSYTMWNIVSTSNGFKRDLLQRQLHKGNSGDKYKVHKYARLHNLFLAVDKASMVTQMQASSLTVWQQ